MMGEELSGGLDFKYDSVIHVCSFILHMQVMLKYCYI
jgi:hypothetical protein